MDRQVRVLYYNYSVIKKLYIYQEIRKFFKFYLVICNMLISIFRRRYNTIRKGVVRAQANYRMLRQKREYDKVVMSETFYSFPSFNSFFVERGHLAGTLEVDITSYFVVEAPNRQAVLLLL